MSIEERTRSLQLFESDLECKVILISLMAGSVGLNLVSANNVVLVDPWWNPAVEQQALDRVHRIGQKKFVRAYKFITVDSVEEKIVEIQKRKQSLVNLIFNFDRNEIKRRNMENLKDIFEMGNKRIENDLKRILQVGESSFHN